MDETLIAVGYAIVGLFLLVLAVLWVMLPFAVFGIKDRIARMTSETSDRLDNIVNEVKAVATDVRGTAERLEALRAELKVVETLLDPEGVQARLHKLHLNKLAEQQLEECRRLEAEIAEKARLRSEAEAEAQRMEEARRAEEEKAQTEARTKEAIRRKEAQHLAVSSAEVNCPHCNHPMTVTDIRAGRRHVCPACKKVFLIDEDAP